MINLPKRITIKIGSNVLTRYDGTTDITRMSALVDQIATLIKKGIQIVLISSGAVASGRSELNITQKLDPLSERQMYSAIGQAKLMYRYYELFRDHGLHCGQILTTKENFSDRQHYLTQKHCIETMLAHQITPIVNENDTISVTELMFTDNDELSGLMAAMIDADSLFILSNIDGVYNGSPSAPSSTLIHEVQSHEDLSSFIVPTRSSFGRGGMLTKCHFAQQMAEEGIGVIIANGKRENILFDLIYKNKEVPHTHFIPAAKGLNPIKRWIAHADDFAKGIVTINQGAKEALLGNKASSLLLVGVASIQGDFEKDDIISLEDEEGSSLGIGRSGYTSDEARLLIGQHNERPLVHYNYLYVNP